MSKIGAVNWSEDDDRWLAENYLTCTKEEAEKRFNKKWHNICNHAQLIGLTRHVGIVKSKKASVKNTISVKDMAQELGIAQEEIMLWSVVYPECITIHSVNGIDSVVFETMVKFLKDHQDLWDSTKLRDRCYFNEYKWFRKKHDADFKKMIQRRWGKDAK